MVGSIACVVVAVPDVTVVIVFVGLLVVVVLLVVVFVGLLVVVVLVPSVTVETVVVSVVPFTDFSIMYPASENNQSTDIRWNQLLH